MGAGDELFSAFGHAAICVFDGIVLTGRCYNYGTADFTTPIPLTWAFIRGRALFWVSTTDLPNMLQYYLSVGRAVWRQELPLGPDDARRVAALLAASAEEHAKYYRYHHFNDNCTTRIRDVLDKGTNGALSLHVEDRDLTFRQYARQGFAGGWPMLVVTDLLLGRPADRRTTTWTAMFLPAELRAIVANRLDAPPKLILAGSVRPPPGATWLALPAFFAFGLILSIIVILATRKPVARRASLWPTAIVLGLIALLLDLLAVLSTFPELRYNELLLAFWPTDFLLPLLTPRRRQRYVALRLAIVALIVILHVGLLVQPVSPLLLIVMPLLTIYFTEKPAP